MNTLINQNITFSYAGYFQSEEDWIHPKRVEKTYEIIYVTQGEVYMHEREREFVLKKGDAVILSPNVMHAGTRITRGVRFYWVHFHTDGELPFEQQLFDSFDEPHLFKKLLHANNLPDSPDYLVNAILVHILAEFCKTARQNDRRGSALAESVYEWLRINASGSLKVSDTAVQFGFSPDYLSRLMKKNYNVGLRELINRFVTAKAQSMLNNTDKYVKEIADELDFVSDKAFISYFKYHTGSFPTEFRAKYSKTHMNNH